MGPNERTTAALVDEYDDYIRKTADHHAKSGIARMLRQQAGNAFAAGDDAAANALRNFAIQIETTLASDQTYGAWIESATIIYDIIRARHERDNDDPG